MANYYNSASTVTNFDVAPSFSFGLATIMMANSIGLLMENAVLAEKGSQQLSNASVAQCCTLIVSAGAAGAAKGK